MILRVLLALCLTLIPDSLALVDQARVLPMDNEVTKRAFILAEVQVRLQEVANTPRPKGGLEPAYKYNPQDAVKITNAIMKWSAHFRLEPLLILSVMTKESSFNPRIHSNMGALGLMQVMRDTVIGKCKAEGFSCPPEGKNPLTYDCSTKKRKRTCKVKDSCDSKICDPEANIEYGVRILAEMMMCSQNFLASLSAYNQGCAGARGDLQSGQSKWTFSTQVMTIYAGYNSRYYIKNPPAPSDFKTIRTAPPAVTPPAD